MSSGGMDWAYRMIAAHDLDALGVAVVLHLGWKDHANFRTDRAMARLFGKDRKSIRRATDKLVALGVIVRRSGQWVACETVAIIEERKGAPVPDAQASDGVAVSRPRGPDAPGGLTPPPPGASRPRTRGPLAPPKRKENMRRGTASPSPAVGQARRAPESGALAASSLDDLNAFQLSCIRADKSVLIGGVLIRHGSPQMETLRASLRAVVA